MWHEPWRLWSAVWVHYGPLHLGTNLSALALLALAGWRLPAQRSDALALLLAWPLTQALLLAAPGLAHVGGLSGLLHAGVVIVALRLLAGGRHAGWLWLAALALKLGWESPGWGGVQIQAGWPFAVAPAAHLAGAAAGLMAWAGVYAVGRWRRVADN